MSCERRSAARTEFMRAGEIRVQNSGAVTHCIVRNFSAAGALIEVKLSDEVPDDFELSVDSIKLHASCAVVRRTKHMLGVRFRA